MPSTVTDRLNGILTSTAVKPPCVAVTSASITLEALQTIGGVALAEGDRVLVKDQATASQNGIYTASTGSWTRATDFDGNRDVVKGTLVLVRSSSADGAIYEVTSANPIIGTSSITFELRDDPAVTYTQIQAEIDAGVTPVNTSFPSDNVLRFGVDPTGQTDTTAALQLAINAAWAYAGSSPNDGINRAACVINLPPGRYKLSGSLELPTGITIRGTGHPSHTTNHTRLIMNSTAVSAPNGAGDNRNKPIFRFRRSTLNDTI